MARTRADKAYEVTWLIRRLFRAMAAAADEYLAKTALSAADRAVMEFLYPDHALSVPDIARRYKVSRQHVQVTVNGLVDKGLLRATDNPQHKRSRLIRLSKLGRETFAGIHEHESEIITGVFADIPDEWLDATHQTLRLLYTKLD